MARKSGNGIEQPTNNATPLDARKKRGRPRRIPDTAMVVSPGSEAKPRKPRAAKTAQSASPVNAKQLAHVTKRAARISELQATIARAQADLASELDALRGELAPNTETKARKPRKGKGVDQADLFAPGQEQEPEPVF